MRTIKTYYKGAPFYNALIGHRPRVLIGHWPRVFEDETESKMKDLVGNRSFCYFFACPSGAVTTALPSASRFPIHSAWRFGSRGDPAVLCPSPANRELERGCVTLATGNAQPRSCVRQELRKVVFLLFFACRAGVAV